MDRMDNHEWLSEPQLKLILEQVPPGERLCWVGGEPRIRYLRKRLVWIVLFSLWTVTADLFAASMILMNPIFLRNSLAGMLPVLTPLILAALGGFLLGREILRPNKRAPDLYALTNRRALVIAPGREVKTWRYDPQAARSIQVRRRRGGSGDILFERSAQWSTDAEGRATRKVKVVGFYGLPCVDEVARWLDQIERPDLARMGRP
jgi:hypothetical protein